MSTKAAARNVYDPRVRELIRATSDPDPFPELGIPMSTAIGWPRGDSAAVCSKSASHLCACVQAEHTTTCPPLSRLIRRSTRIAARPFLVVFRASQTRL